MEKYALKDDLECLQKYEKVYESETANQLTKAYTEASIVENMPDDNLSQEDLTREEFLSKFNQQT